MLSRLDLRGRRLGLQLYPDKDHGVLINAIKAQGAEVVTVLPYVYDAQAADTNIVTAIDEMAQGRVDAIALTNLGQVRRLVETARAHGREDELRKGLERTLNRVGRAGRFGRTPDLRVCAPIFRRPTTPISMKPLISAIATQCSRRRRRRGRRRGNYFRRLLGPRSDTPGYASLMPFSSEVLARQPSFARRLTSSSLRGVPPGFDGSKPTSPR